jgi:hypothetical protein
MTKNDKKDVNISCFGKINGCLVNHCNLAHECDAVTVRDEIKKSGLKNDH